MLRTDKMKAVTYTRLSTNKQTYGIAAQTMELLRFCESNEIEIVNQFSEIDSGANDDRAELKRAIEYSKKHNVKLIVSKLCRLTRDIGHLQNIIKSGVDLVVAQFGLNCPSFLLNVVSCANSYERELISLRTKEALKECKRQGVKLGNPKIEEARVKAAKANKARGLATANRYGDIITMLRSTGLTWGQVADKMNGMGLRTPTNRLWIGNSVRILAKRLTKQ